VRSGTCRKWRVAVLGKPNARIRVLQKALTKFVGREQTLAAASGPQVPVSGHLRRGAERAPERGASDGDAMDEGRPVAEASRSTAGQAAGWGGGARTLRHHGEHAPALR
jgi:hypothetical protein